MKIHVVKKGETLFSIARQYGVSARLLQKQNEVPEDGALVPGQTRVVLTVDSGSRRVLAQDQERDGGGS